MKIEAKRMTAEEIDGAIFAAENSPDSMPWYVGTVIRLLCHIAALEKEIEVYKEEISDYCKLISRYDRLLDAHCFKKEKPGPKNDNPL